VKAGNFFNEIDFALDIEAPAGHATVNSASAPEFGQQFQNRGGEGCG